MCYSVIGQESDRLSETEDGIVRSSHCNLFSECRAEMQVSGLKVWLEPDGFQVTSNSLIFLAFFVKQTTKILVSAGALGATGQGGAKKTDTLLQMRMCNS